MTNLHNEFLRIAVMAVFEVVLQLLCWEEGNKSVTNGFDEEEIVKSLK